MSTTLNYRYNVDLPEWRALCQPLAGAGGTSLFGSGSGQWMAIDMRCRDYQHPLVHFNYAGVLYSYSPKFDGWAANAASIGLVGTNGVGATAAYCPTFSPMGTIAAGGTVNKITLTTALPASVTTNQLANRGDGQGFIIRIIGNAAGSSGKIEERRIIANTSGTTPTIWFDKPLSFTPATGDRYEFLSGSVLFLNTGTASLGVFRRYDVLTNSFSSLSVTGMIATIPVNFNQLIPLDEQYVPYDRNPGEGQLVGAATYDISGDFTKGCLTATAATSTNITGQASAGDSAVVANQYRNYQIRIVEDTVNTTAVGQRRRISSHTAGPSAVYSIASTWTVTPSTNCKFVIENDTDRVIALHAGTTTVYNYFISNLGNTTATANTWDTSSWALRPATAAAGALTWHAFGIKSAAENTVKSSTIVSWRGASLTYDVLDISGGATGTWTTNTISNLVSSSSDAILGAQETVYFAYNPHSQNGVYMYTALGGNTSLTNVQRMYIKFNTLNGSVEKIVGPRVTNGTTSINGFGMSFCSVFQDGTTKIAFYNTTRLLSGTDYYSLMLI
jgi:hypothetical protein